MEAGIFVALAAGLLVFSFLLVAAARGLCSGSRPPAAAIIDEAGGRL
jgi:hypothetical protein